MEERERFDLGGSKGTKSARTYRNFVEGYEKGNERKHSANDERKSRREKMKNRGRSISSGARGSRVIEISRPTV